MVDFYISFYIGLSCWKFKKLVSSIEISKIWKLNCNKGKLAGVGGGFISLVQKYTKLDQLILKQIPSISAPVRAIRYRLLVQSKYLVHVFRQSGGSLTT
jgi:hypothetical protein